MIPLERNQRVLTWLCGLPPHESYSEREKIGCIVFTLCFVTTTIAGEISSSLFIYRNVLVDLEETLYALYHTIAGVQIVYQSVATVLLRRKLSVIFKSLSTIYDKSERKYSKFY